jgi:hypothetical protein
VWRIGSSYSLAGRSHRNFKSKNRTRNIPLVSESLGALARLDARFGAKVKSWIFSYTAQRPLQASAAGKIVPMLSHISRSACGSPVRYVQFLCPIQLTPKWCRGFPARYQETRVAPAATGPARDPLPAGSSHRRADELGKCLKPASSPCSTNAFQACALQIYHMSNVKVRRSRPSYWTNSGISAQWGWFRGRWTLSPRWRLPRAIWAPHRDDRPRQFTGRIWP